MRDEYLVTIYASVRADSAADARQEAIGAAQALQRCAGNVADAWAATKLPGRCDAGGCR